MSELRSVGQRKADVLTRLGRNEHGFLATAGTDGRPHLIVAATWWHKEELVLATIAGSRTARNLEATGRARLALGSFDDAVMVDAEVAEVTPAAGSELAAGFEAAQGWNPATEPGGWVFARLRPTRIQAYRGYEESEGRDVMRRGAWLA